MIRIVVVDDHPALRAGLQTVLQGEPGFVAVGEASGEDDVWPVLRRARPDVVLLDYHLQHGDGVQICVGVKQQLLAPAVLMYSAYAGAELVIPSIIAGADGIVSKLMAARELFDAVRRVARGERCMPPVSHAMLHDAHGRIAPEDRPLLGMLLDGASASEVGDVLGVSSEQVQHRIRRLLHELQVEVPSSAA